ncbi:MAG TPA: hypothetical protein VEI46_10205 [Thermodesulfovibrionales bacterium]|nr:hypothetical protein [Thermodesulfovibrionales bacterium]
MPKIVTYECTQCGSEIVVTESLESELSPIYCCGIEVAEIATKEKKPARPKKKTVKKVAKKGAKKRATAKKKPAAKGKASRKS